MKTPPRQRPAPLGPDHANSAVPLDEDLRPTERTRDVHVRGTRPLTAPGALAERLPLSERARGTVLAGREAIRAILAGRDPRMIAVVGPCSIHDEEVGLDYAWRLHELAHRVRERIVIIMRVYFEKPRTTIGWKGLLYDPHLDGSFDIETGLYRGREMLLKINEFGLPAATEMLDPITPQYLADLIAWASIGARTIESQTHRQMASGLSMPVGFKNGTEGNFDGAVQAMVTARHPHSFLGIDMNGVTSLVQTSGNPWSHLILRGGRSGPNHAPEHVAAAAACMVEAGLRPSIMVDCSHANSQKDHRRQGTVWRSVVEQRRAGNANLVGMMLESNIAEGRQDLAEPARLQYGVSITDACIGWELTEELVMEAASLATGSAA